MLDLILNADLLTKVTSLLTGFVGLLTAIVAFRKTRTIEHTQTSTTSRLKLRSFDGIQIKRWSPLWLKVPLVLCAVISSLMMVTGLVLFVLTPSFSSGFPALVFGAFTAVYIFLLKRLWGKEEPVSIISREATLNLQGTYDVVVEECVTALRKMRSQITAISKDGTIQAKTGLSWRSWGETIVIRITEIGENEYAVIVQSRPTYPTVVLDHGKNASNINRFVRELLR